MLSFLMIICLVAAVNAEPLYKRYPLFPPGPGRIVGGENAIIETYPYQISLEHYGHHNCGGAIVSKYYVVTAGDCVDVPVEAVTVRAGSSLHGKGGSVHQIDKIVRHEKFMINQYGIPINDVAVLRVKEPFQFDEKRQAIPLYDVDEEAKTGAEAVVTGWGKTDQGYPIQLQTVSLPIIGKETCDVVYKIFGGLSEGQICAGYYEKVKKNTCYGDSGGPLAIEGRLAGIVSWSCDCTRQSACPGVYAEIAAYRDWINEHAEL